MPKKLKQWADWWSALEVFVFVFIALVALVVLGIQAVLNKANDVSLVSLSLTLLVG